MARDSNTFTKTILFKPSSLRSLRDGSTRVENITLGGNKEKTQGEANLISTSSFRYDPAGFPLKSTQQLNVDWSKLENHTFFNSAQVKVQTAFDKIINRFPFDGTKSEYIEFRDNLTGFDKYILDTFPKNLGSLKFDRAYNNALRVQDYQGAGLISGKKGSTGQAVLDFSYMPFSIETHIFIPSGSINDNEVVLQKISGSSSGLTLAVTSSAYETSPHGEATLWAYLSSGSTAISASLGIKKGVFNHVALVYDRNDTGKLFIYGNGNVPNESSKAAVFNDYDFIESLTTIGSGTVHQVENINFTPVQNLSGALDELRWFHKTRNRNQILSFKDRSIFANNQDDLRLYFRFNEPSGSFGTSSTTGNEDLVLDYSGNGLHTKISNFNMSLRETGSLPVAMSQEDPALSPILFPSYRQVADLGVKMLLSGSQYDYNNPNLITKLIPKHYLLEASEREGMENEWGDIGESPGYYTDQPGGSKMRSPQIIASLLYMWAESFDEMKMFIDEFGRALNVDYLTDQTISDQLLPFLARYYGLNLPNAYADASMAQLLDRQDVRMDNVLAVKGLQGVQNVIWRRVLSGLPEVIKSKGTRYSIEALFRNMGINPDGSFRIREYGGSRTKSISDTFEKRSEIASILDFSGSKSSGGVIDGSGKSSNRPLIQSSYLSSSRLEPGKPLSKIRYGDYVSGVSPYSGDGLYTSGSWTVEGTFKLENPLKNPLTQSLMRMQTTGSRASGVANNWLIFNTVATALLTSSNSPGTLSLYGRVGSGSSETLKLTMTGVNVFDGNKWHVSFGRLRNDEIGSYVSSSYFLRAGRMGTNSVLEFYTTSSYYNDQGDTILNRVSSSNNASGSFITIGSQSLMYDTSTTSGGGFLNEVSDSKVKYVNFTGKCAGIRFFSKGLSEKETLQHVRNFKSLGVENPHVNFNFNTSDAGSFERLRLNLSIDQPVTKSNAAGNVQIFDFSQNNNHGLGTGFETNVQIIRPERYDYMILSPRFELATDPNKIRIRSFIQAENVRSNGMSDSSYAPLYRIPENEKPKDDRRLAIEVSSVQALNEDIMNIFSTLDSLDNAIGNPELVFSQEYKSLRHLRKIYFNRLDDKMSLKKFFEFFKWFDQTIGDILEEVIPSTTKYMGTNFVIESHALERAKFPYKYSDMYVGILDRREASVIFLQQFLGRLRKF